MMFFLMKKKETGRNNNMVRYGNVVISFFIGSVKYGEWRKLHNFELRSLKCSLDTFEIMRWSQQIGTGVKLTTFIFDVEGNILVINSCIALSLSRLTAKNYMKILVF